MREEIASALRQASTGNGQDRCRLNTLRLITAAIRDRDAAAKAAGRDRVGDDEVLEILARMIRQRIDSSRAYEEAGRIELAEEERAEICVIKSFLPSELSEEEIRSACVKAIADTDAQGLRDMGRCMAELKSRYGSRMDLGKAVQIVRSKLQ
jgi:uncharacterized protein YqeY